MFIKNSKNVKISHKNKSLTKIKQDRLTIVKMTPSHCKVKTENRNKKENGKIMHHW